MRFNKVVIIGTGFMGGSLAKDLKRKHLSDSVWGIVRNKKRAEEISRLNIFDRVTSDLKAALPSASLVVLAVPVFSICEYIKKISPLLGRETTVTDLGSTKAEIIKTARRFMPNNFVGSHPLCGSEKRGAEFSQKGLFRGSVCLVTPLKKNRRFNLIKKLWKDLGAEPIALNAEEHDRILASTSGLPHVLSFTLTRYFPHKLSKFAAGSLRDLTRVSISDSGLWTDIFLSNCKEIKKAVLSYIRELTGFLSYLDENDKKKMYSFLKRINQKKQLLFKSR